MADENNTNNENYAMKMPEETPVPPPAPAAAPTVAAATPAAEPIIPTHEKHSRIAPVIGILIVILVLALGALYIWGAMLSKQVQDQGEEMATTTDEAAGATEHCPPEESFDAVDSEIDAEMNAFDTEMNEIDAELQTI